VAADKKYFDAVFKSIPIIPLTDSIIQEAVAIRQTHNISVADSIISATTITTHAELVTRNTEDFKNIKKLKLINPVDK
jgi:toxin FitB